MDLVPELEEVRRDTEALQALEAQRSVWPLVRQKVLSQTLAVSKDTKGV